MFRFTRLAAFAKPAAAVATAGTMVAATVYTNPSLVEDLREKRLAFKAPRALFQNVASPFPTVYAAEKAVDFGAVRKEIEAIIDRENCGPMFVRLGWHASGTYDKRSKTGGSDGGNIRHNPEANHGANSGLHIARYLLEPVKEKFGDGLSYADLFTLAAVVAVESMGGPKVPWRSGRTDTPDGRRCTPDGRLPDAAQGAKHVRDIFYRMGFDDREIVALVGAHSVGECHADRSGFVGPWDHDPYGWTNAYYTNLLEMKWRVKKGSNPEQYEDEATGTLMMLPADMAFLFDPTFKKYVEMYAKDEELWHKDFSKAFAKLLELGCKF